MADKAEKTKTRDFDSKQMLSELVDKKEKIKYNDRLEVEITETTQFYTKGDIIAPHKTFAEALIKQGFAKKYVNKDE